MGKCRIFSLKFCGVLLGLSLGTLNQSVAALAPGDTNAVPKFKKVFMIVLENTDAEVALTNPYLRGLAQSGAYLNQFYAETHPSQPNYIALISGSTHGVTSNSAVNLPGLSIVDLLEAKGKTWKTYQEGYPMGENGAPLECFTGKSHGKYVRKHNPFISFLNIQNNPTRCARIVDEKQFFKDVELKNIPDFSVFVPDMDNGGHDTDVHYAGEYLSRVFGPYLKNPDFMKDMLFIVTFDEGSLTGTNRIYFAMFGSSVIPGSTSQKKVGFYNFLRTLEEAWGLGTLGQGDSTSSKITGVWR
jgi:hypothetical protein